MSAGMVGPRQPVGMAYEPIPTQTMLVKTDCDYGDPYEALAAQLPDIAKLNGYDFADGVDAMELAGLPSGVSVEKWRPTARYYNGVTDQTAAGRAERMFGRYQTGAGQVCTHAGMSPNGVLASGRQFRGRGAGAVTPMNWQPPTA